MGFASTSEWYAVHLRGKRDYVCRKHLPSYPSIHRPVAIPTNHWRGCPPQKGNHHSKRTKPQTGDEQHKALVGGGGKVGQLAVKVRGLSPAAKCCCEVARFWMASGSNRSRAHSNSFFL